MEFPPPTQHFLICSKCSKALHSRPLLAAVCMYYLSTGVLPFWIYCMVAIFCRTLSLPCLFWARNKNFIGHFNRLWFCFFVFKIGYISDFLFNKLDCSNPGRFIFILPPTKAQKCQQQWDPIGVSMLLFAAGRGEFYICIIFLHHFFCFLG